LFLDEKNEKKKINIWFKMHCTNPSK